MATDYVNQMMGNAPGLDAGFDDTGKQLRDAINAYIDSMPDDVKQLVLGRMKDPIAQAVNFFQGDVDAGKLRAAFETMQNSFGKVDSGGNWDPAAAPDWVRRAAPAQPAGGTTTGAGGQSISVATPGAPYDPSKGNYAQVGAIGYTGSSDPASLAAMVGQDAAAFQNEYNDYLKHRQQIIDAQRNSGLRVEAPRGLSMGQFAQSKAFAMQGQWQPLLDAFDYQWNELYGQRLPAELRQQLLAALGKMDANERQAVLTAEMQYVSSLQTARGTPTGIAGALQALSKGLTGQVPAHIGALTEQYAQAHPDIGKEISKDAQIRQQNYIQWMQGHNVAITPDLLAKLAAMPASSSLTNPEPGSDFAYLLTLPSDIKGMTWGQKDIAMSNIGSQWRQYFGREPNAQELQWASGKNPTEIQDFVDNSPSHVPGVTIGRYNDYVSFINKIGTSGSTHAFSAGVDDSLIHDLHQHLTEQSTQASTPGPLPSA